MGLVRSCTDGNNKFTLYDHRPHEQLFAQPNVVMKEVKEMR